MGCGVRGEGVGRVVGQEGIFFSTMRRPLLCRGILQCTRTWAGQRQSKSTLRTIKVTAF